MIRTKSVSVRLVAAGLLIAVCTSASANMLTNGSFEDLTAAGVPSVLLENVPTQPAQYMHLLPEGDPTGTTQNVGNTGWATPVDLLGWAQSGTATNGAGAYNPPGAVPDGNNVLFTNGSSIANFNYAYQTLADTLQADTAYTLSFINANTAAAAQHVQLVAGGVVLDELTGLVAAGATASLVVNSNNHAGHLGQPLEVRIRAVGGQSWYDAMSLETAPAGFSVGYIDDEDAGWSTTGSWGEQVVDRARDDDEWFQIGADDGSTSTWAFEGLPKGRYMVYASWQEQGNLTTAATYSLSDGFGTINDAVNQKTAGSFDVLPEIGGVDVPLVGAGEHYARLSNATFEVSDGTLAVTASDQDAGAGATEYLMIDAARIEKVADDAEAVYVIDNESRLHNNGTFATTGGGWGVWDGDPGDHYKALHFGTTADATATYTFTGVENGHYRVSANWTGGGNRPTDAKYSIAGYSDVVVNQIPGADDERFEESAWERLFGNVEVTDNTLTVTVGNAPGGSGNAVIADAVRLEKLIGTPVNILNASFEDQKGTILGSDGDAIAIGNDPGDWTDGVVPEWDDHFALPASAGLFNPPFGAQDGDLVAYLNGGGYLVQDLEFAGGTPLTAVAGEAVSISFFARIGTGVAGSVRLSLRGVPNNDVALPVVVDIPSDVNGYTLLTANLAINEAAALGALEDQPIFLVFDLPTGGQVWLDNISGMTTLVPEPSSFALLLVAAIGLVPVARRRR